MKNRQTTLRVKGQTLCKTSNKIKMVLEGEQLRRCRAQSKRLKLSLAQTAKLLFVGGIAVLELTMAGVEEEDARRIVRAIMRNAFRAGKQARR